MSSKLACPGCSTYTSERLRQFEEGESCGTCGLSAAATGEILAVRRVQADEQLKAQLEAALIRAGKAEGERDYLAAKLQTVRWALEDLMGKLS